MKTGNNNLPPGGHGILIVNGKKNRVTGNTTRNVDNHVTIWGGEENEVSGNDGRNSPEWEEKKRRAKRGFLGGVAVAVVGGGILHFLGWA
jgi:hypothetical protein